MSLQAYLFFASTARNAWTAEKIRVCSALLLPLMQLKVALFGNPAVKRLLPALVAFLFSSFPAEAKNRSLAPAVFSELGESAWDEAALLWVSMRLGVDCCHKQWLQTTLLLLLLRRIQHAQSRGFDPLFADSIPLSVLRILPNSIEATPSRDIPAFLQVFARLLAPQQRLFASLPPPRGDTLRQAVALSVFSAVFGRLKAAYSTFDALVREEAISADVGVSSRTAGTAQRELLGVLVGLCSMEPFEVFGCVIDVRIPAGREA